MIKLKNILLEAMSKVNVQTIVDRVLPQIAQDRGLGKQGMPKIELHHDIYARLSGIEDMRGEESDSTKAQWVDKDNTIYIYYPNMMNEEDVIRSVLHEFEHTHQDAKKNEKYREQGYDNNPYEIAARNAEKNWKQYTTIDEVDYHARLSRGHKPDYYQLGTSEFKPFDKSRDDIEENITQNLIDAWKKETSSSELKMFCKRDGCGPAALDLMSFAKERGIKLKRIEGFFHADKVASEKKDFTPEMKDEFLDQGGNFNDAEEREEWVENSKYSDQWKFIPHYWLEDDKGNIYDPVGQEQFIDMGFANDLNKERYTLTDEVNENFADGKNPGRKGISKRVGIPKGATLTQLAKLAKSKGEKGRMARWQLNMRRGRKKKK